MSDARSTTPLERLQALSAAATPGPWKADPKRLVIDHGNGLKSGGPVMSYLAGDRSSGEGMKVSLGSERIADHQFVAELVNAFRAGLLTPPSETKAISRDDLETALNIALAALGHFNTEQTDKHWNEQERELRQIEKRMRLSTPSAGVALTPAEVIERCAAIVDEMQEAWHDSTEENSGHYMDAAQRIADVLRERAKHAPFLAGTPVSATAPLKMDAGGGDLEILRVALGNTAACLGDALATLNRLVGEEVFRNSTPSSATERRCPACGMDEKTVREKGCYDDRCRFEATLGPTGDKHG